ncbi:patatin-like phospholipase family protein [Chitinophagaceae bacterium MMS25-I14]
MKFFLPVILLLASAQSIKAQTYKNLVLEGGGIRGIAYAGAIQVLEEHNIITGINNVAGTSVGAITAALIGTGYSAAELKQLLFSLKIQSFNDGRGFFIGGQKRTRKQYGWYRGDAIEKWIGRAIEAKTGNAHTTFLQLHQLAQKDRRYKDLYITATNLSKQKAEIFNWHTYPDMELKTAIRASMSVPVYFTAVCINDKGQRVKKPGGQDQYNVFVDGGIMANYPLGLFDSVQNGVYVADSSTLGLKLERPEQIRYFDSSDRAIAPYNIKAFNTYVAALYNVIIEGLNRDKAFAHEAFRTIYISTDNIQPRVRHIPDEQKTLLYNNGVKAAQHFFGTHR